jgi:2-methylcitrate dehydratase PrpD
MTMATELARRIRAFTYDGLPDAALEWAKTGILDTVGVTLAGSAEPCAQIMLRVCTATGPALVFGATAAASRLLELTQDQTATALAIAASFSSGSRWM